MLNEFDRLYYEDEALQKLLGEFPDRYTIEEKLSIVQAYKKAGGVHGLDEIIDTEDDDEQHLSGAQGGQGDNLQAQRVVDGSGDQGEEEEEDIDIDLANPKDVQLIEDEFKKLYDGDEEFRNNFGEQAFELGPLQKYQVLDAYNTNGMQAVMALLLANSADQSGIMQQLDGQG